MKKYALEILVTFLALLLLFSYTPFFIEKAKAKKILFVKKNEEVLMFSIKRSEKSLCFFMQKNKDGEGDFWKCNVTEFNKEAKTNTFPVEQKTVRTALEGLKCNIKMYKISDIKKDSQPFFLAQKEPIILSFNILFRNNGKISIKTYGVFLGTLDFTEKKRYLTLSSKKGIWKSDYDFLEFSDVDENFWLDPYVIPENLFPDKKNVQLFRVKFYGKEKIILPENIDMENLLRLRHGKLFFESSKENLSKKSDMKISLEFGKGNFLSMDFYKVDDGNMIISYSSNEWNYSVRLSERTYNSMLNILGLSGENHNNE